MNFFAKRKKAIKVFGTLITVGLVTVSSVFSVSAQKLTEKYEALYSSEAVEYVEKESYSTVKKQWESEGFSTVKNQIVKISALDYESYEGEKPTDITVDNLSSVYWDNKTKSISYKITVSKSGMYAIRMTYRAETGEILPVYRSVAIDGEIPYSQSENIALQRYYVMTEDNYFNSNGDEIAAELGELEVYKTAYLRDNAGVYTEPLLWLLTEGEHTITFGYIDRAMYMTSFEVCSLAEIEAYEDSIHKEKADEADKTDKSIVFQAEDSKYLSYVTNSVFTGVADGDPANLPKGVTKIRLNTIGGTAWSSGNQEIAYKFNVAKSGVYKLAFRVKQAWNNGLSSYRQIKIDGEVPFKELSAYEFKYNRNWYTEILSNSKGDNYYVYLTEGEHTLSLSVVMNEQMAQIKEKAEEGSELLSKLYRDILLITGSNPDMNYDYQLQKSITDLEERLAYIAELAQSSIELATENAGKGSSVVSNLELILKTVTELKEKPDSIQKRIDDMVDSMTVLGTVISDVQYQPLLMDEIGIYSKDTEINVRNSNIFTRFWATVQNFIISFNKDYTSIGETDVNENSGKTIEVWVSRGKEWATVMQELISSDFISEYSTGVKINVLPTNSLSGTINPLLLSITSGDTPDLIVGVAPNIAVEYAIRDIVVDYTQFDDFEEISKRFPKNSFASQTYNNGVYGLPETITYNVMIYRKDILNSLGLAVPKNWQEVYYQLLPVLYQNSMEMTAPTFETILYQKGGKYYSDDGLKPSLTNAVGHEAFEEYISMFLDLGFPITADFYNRFRTGEMPIGIADAATYMKVLTAAPELADKWDISLIPAYQDENGNKNNTTVGLLATSCIIMNDSNMKEESWQFLKWWTSAKTQTAFANRMEAMLGTSARWNSANTEAFETLPWSSNHKEVILQAVTNATDIPQVLGGSITNVAINNAKNSALYEGVTPREALEKAVETISDEFKRKQKLYNIGSQENREDE